MELYFNKEKAIEKGIYTEGKPPKTYVKIANVYKKIFERYLCQCIDIKKYDDQLMDSNLGIDISELSEERINYIKEYLDFKFIVNINVFFVENLDKEDLDILKSYVKGEHISHRILFDIVKRTYKSVLKDSCYDDETEKIYVNYISYNECDEFRNGALAFRIRYRINTKFNTREEFFEEDHKREQLLKDIATNIKEEVKAKLHIDCDVLVSLER